MKYILENEFTWDGIYSLLDENGKQAFLIDARIEDSGRVISICNADGKELGRVKQKRDAKRPEYEFTGTKQKLGGITRRGADYDIKYMDWFVSGNILYWDFRVVDKRGDIAESFIYDDRLGFEVADKNNALGATILMMGIAGLAGDLAIEFSGEKRKDTDVHDVVDTVEGIAEKAGRFGQKTFVALEKLYGVYEEKEEEEDPLMEKKNLHDVVDSVEEFAEKAQHLGNKTKGFLTKLYGLDEEAGEDKGRE